MSNLTEHLRSIDVFSKEPTALTFGDPDSPKTRNLWKTSYGGFTTIMFASVLMLYVYSSFAALDSGDKDLIEDTTRSNEKLVNTSATLEEMKIMPVVTFNV